MVPGANGHAIAIELLGHVMGVRPLGVEHETDDPALILRCRPDDPYAAQRFEHLVRPPGQPPFVLLDGLEPDGVEVVDGRPQGHGRYNRRRAGLELARQIERPKALQRHFLDHPSAAEERRHGLQQRQLAVKHADARGAQHFMSAEGQEIDVRGLHVDLHVGYALPHRPARVPRRRGRGE